MKRTNRRSIPSFLSPLLALAVVTLAFAGAATAQQSATPELRITRVDASAFPNVKVYVYGRDLGKEFADIPLAISQDGIDQAITENAVVDVGAQLVLLLDASADIRKPGQTGDPRFVEVSNVVSRLAERSIFDPRTDWMAAFAPASGDAIEPIIDWTRDHGAVRNEVYIYEPPEAIGETPLFKLVYFGLDSFADPQLDDSAQRSMVVFSDGVDNVGPEWVLDAGDRAADLNVTIHTVLLGEGTAAARANLERLAARTGGQFTQLTSTEALDSLFAQIAEGRTQRLLGYRSATATPSTVAVTAELEQGSEEAEAPVNAPALQPARVQILEPAANTAIQRQADSPDAPLRSLTPASIPVQVSIDWPDGRPRTLRRVEYTIGNDTQIRESEPFDAIDLSIAGLGEGDYGLRVRAIDELGIAGEAPPQSLAISVLTPVAPTAAPPPAPTPPPPCTLSDPACYLEQNPSRVALAAIALTALAALLAAVVLLLRRPAKRRNDALTTVVASDATTQAFVLRQPGASQGRLQLVEGNAKIPTVIDLSLAATRIGRDAGLADVVLDDPRVSRYHCRIVRKEDGSFSIHDEGSTSGTYVNYQLVGMTGQRLNDGDQVHIGPVGLRFELIPPAAGDVTMAMTAPVFQQFGTASDDDPFKTEPFEVDHPKGDR